MRIHRFYVDGPLAPDATVSLAREQARQARAVLRLGPGDTIELIDGTGVVATALLSVVERDAAQARVQSLRGSSDETPLDLTVGLALLRGERFDLAVQKLTEIGVRRIVPLSARHCVVSYAVDREWERRATRLRRIAIEAAEQAERVTVPLIAAPSSVDQFLADHGSVSIVLVERRPDVPLLMDVPIGRSAAIMVGPEGGWDESERAAITASAREASLGPLILRAETAAIVAAGSLMQRAWTSDTHRETGI